MISTETPTETRICSCCLRTLPVESFRRIRRGSDSRRSICRSCRRVTDKARRDGVSRQTIAAACAEIRRRNSAESILNIIQQLARHFGGMERMSRQLAALLENEPPSGWKVKLYSAIIHATAVADQERTLNATQATNPTPEQFVRDLHAAGRLAPILRGMYSEGSLDFDHIDPPPGDHHGLESKVM